MKLIILAFCFTCTAVASSSTAAPNGHHSGDGQDDNSAAGTDSDSDECCIVEPYGIASRNVDKVFLKTAIGSSQNETETSSSSENCETDEEPLAEFVMRHSKRARHN
ncbi:unnamed protein product [Gongylonema pulchrum]|uniref:Secreted protein n=1 Tax=Gongylonema pulchrum TaxID=637853 RepID=A0A183EAT5_9BILA|nr:unnamed protein product [Gongylonema pulchrum]